MMDKTELTAAPAGSGACVPGRFELRFQSLFHAGKALAFPCDARGDVLLDTLSAKAMENYLFARAVVGHEYANPVVQPCCAA
jgi:hypothetical protein